MRKRKSLNPMKLWGAYLGAIIGILVFFFFIPAPPYDANQIYSPYGLISSVVNSGLGLSLISFQGWFTIFIWIIVGLISGFIIGGFIHFIVRLIKNAK